MKFTETELGFEYSHEKYLIFFGNKNANIQNLKSNYSQFDFKRVKQCHSDLIVDITSHSQDLTEQADALMTTEKNLALAVNTADCIPVLVVSKDFSKIAAIHAGWRGVSNQISKKTILKMNTFDNSVFIGPHILKSSFEVTLDTQMQLLEPIPTSEKKNYYVQSDQDHYHIDLSKVLEKQIDEYTFEFQKLLLDTKSDL